MNSNAGGRFVYRFDEGRAELGALLGGKGANLAEMTRVGLPVPPGFTITTEACNAYLKKDGRFPAGLEEQIGAALADLEQRMDRRFGDRSRPLLVSVRSGAAVSMPGMMDTILNLGLSEDTVEGLAEQTGDRRFTLDCYRRLIQMFGNVVLGLAHEGFERLLESQKRSDGVVFDMDLTPSALEILVRRYKDWIKAETGGAFPEDPLEQLTLAVKAVFDSWNNERAAVYRRLHKIADDLGTAVNIQAMVFGNMGADSGTGVLFTRDPSTGAASLYGEFLMNAQGEDVVAGIRTPRPIQELEDAQPAMYAQIVKTAELLERHYRDMQDIEFTVEQGRLFILQTRSGKRTAGAAVKIAHDMVAEERIDRSEALLRVEPEHLERLLHKSIGEATAAHAAARGLPASPGAASGLVVFDSDEAEKLAAEGVQVILVRTETAPDDIHGMAAAQGILTSRGGMTCHAAIVARGMGKPCVVGCDAISIDFAAEKLRVRGHEQVISKGDHISIDGSTGRVFIGHVPLVDPELTDEFRELLSWADQASALAVRANADTPADSIRAREFGAVGIGLCRTEHMFMDPKRLPVVQAMILAPDEAERRAALANLLPMQQEDFEGIFRAMDGLPVTIRLLDPPLHEFLPDREQLAVELALLRAAGRQSGGIDDAGTDVSAIAVPGIAEKEALLARVRVLNEANPMLGHRGCRLGITFPEIYEMQVRAIFQAAARLTADGVNVLPEIMIPLVSHRLELEWLRDRVLRVAAEVEAETGIHIPALVGTMIEVPRACVTAGEIAGAAEFFSFGTNDLTQTVFGFSRDDAEAKFMHHYLQAGLLPENPFISLDTEGVGRLIEMAVVSGREQRPGLKLGICGEHGGDPASVEFFSRLGLDYVSCSPFRVPIARLAAAQAAIRSGRNPSG
ncbi:MAG: pyruvate, phosphate dikinase [Thermaerobacterales bacterium]